MHCGPVIGSYALLYRRFIFVATNAWLFAFCPYGVENTWLV